MPKVIVNFDGHFSRRNGCLFAWVAFDETGAEVSNGHGNVPDKYPRTSTVAELWAMYEAIRISKTLAGFEDVLIQGDFRFAIDAMNGDIKFKEPYLSEIVRLCLNEVGGRKEQFQFQVIPRKKNWLADKISGMTPLTKSYWDKQRRFKVPTH